MSPPQTASSAVAHGGDIIATAKRLGCRIADLVDMSSNLTPLGMAPGLRDVLVERLEEISFLPETDSTTLRHLFSARFGFQSSEVLIGNGTTEFIFAVPAALRPKRALIINPTYADYRLASEWAALPLSGFILRPEEEFRLDLTRLADHLSGEDLVFFCNPNNPTGTLIPSEELHRLAAARPDSFFLVDESYLPFTREKSLLELSRLPNLLVLSSFSKIYGIPGLRLGFLTATPTIMSRLAARRKPWGVNRLAQIAGEFLIQHGESYRQEVIRYLETQRPLFVNSLAALPGVLAFPGVTNYILARLTGRIGVAELRARLLTEHRIMIRDCSNFESLDESFFRISLKREQDNQKCLAGMKKILEG